MSLLLRATDLIGRPVVTLEGDDIAEVKDVVLGLDQHCLVGFTLRGRGLFARSAVRSVAWERIAAIGRDAVMVDDSVDLSEEGLELSRGEGDDLGDVAVMTDGGQRLGNVVDVVLTTGPPASVVGFEVESSAELSPERRRVLLPVDEMLAVSERAMVVPAAATHYVRDDLTGFGVSAAEYRDRARTGADDEAE